MKRKPRCKARKKKFGLATTNNEKSFSNNEKWDFFKRRVQTKEEANKVPATPMEITKQNAIYEKEKVIKLQRV